MTHLARWCFRHRLTVVALWLIVLVVLAGATKREGKDFVDGFSLPGTGSSQAQQLLSHSGLRAGSGDDKVVFHTLRRDERVTDPGVRAGIERTLAVAASKPYVASIRSPFAKGGGAQVSANGRIAYASVDFDQPDQALTESDTSPFVSTMSSLRGSTLQVEFGGGGFQTLKGSPFSGSAFIGLAAAALVLLLAFGSVPAAVIPLLAAIAAVGAGIQTVSLLSHVLTINSLTPSIAALIGIGVAVDYALFVVTRHRSGLRSGRSVEASAVTALATSGRAVVFAGATVAIAMLGLLILRVDFLTAVGLAAAITVVYSVAAATTLLPALFALLGGSVLSRRERRRMRASSDSEAATDPDVGQGGGWLRWATFVQRRPVLLSGAALAAVVVLIVPALSIRLGASDQGNDPTSSTTRAAYDLLARGFGPGANGPLLLVARTGGFASREAFTRLEAAVRTTPGVASAAEVPTSGGGVGALEVIPTTSPQSADTTDLIDHLRERVIPAAEHGTTLRVHIGGETAVFDDFAAVLSGKLPLFLTVVIVLGFLLLMLAFRSVVIPLTAAVMNVLAAGAAFGVVVAVFQWGWGSSAIGLGPPGPIESFLPVMLLAILFGLSMDYQVFLVSRIHEEWVHDGDTARAVRVGQARTGRVITAAAVIMVFVFAAFVLEGRRPIGEFGLGLAAAILLDALLLRTILVPAAMQLLGDHNWWLPPWLDRLLPHLDIESDLPAATPPPDERPPMHPVVPTADGGGSAV